MEKVRLMSLDCSTRRTGYAVWDDGEYVESNVINCDKITESEQRQKQMGLMIWKGLNYYNPSIVYVEDTYCHGNPDVQKKLNRIQGVVYAWCITHNAKFNCIMPSSWRKHIPGFPNGKGVKRQEQKNFSITYVMDKFGFTPKGDDESDAILIGLGALNMRNE